MPNSTCWMPSRPAQRTEHSESDWANHLLVLVHSSQRSIKHGTESRSRVVALRLIVLSERARSALQQPSNDVVNRKLDSAALQ
jgi:hypothetical protein